VWLEEERGRTLFLYNDRGERGGVASRNKIKMFAHPRSKGWSGIGGGEGGASQCNTHTHTKPK